MKNEIILYRPNELTEHIEVKFEEETVWLSQQQMATLFSQTKQNISLHINNCFKENELEKLSTEENSIKLFHAIPLRTSIVPQFVTFDTKSIILDSSKRRF